MKAGKPVLFLLGPSNDAPPSPFERQPPEPGPDGLELLLTELGIRLPQQTILYDSESQALAEQQAGFLIMGPPGEVPPVTFEGKSGKAHFESGADKLASASKAHPIRTSLRLAARSVGKKGALDLQLRNPRPVYYDPDGTEHPTASATFMATSPDSWNESQPFSTEDYTPKFERPKADDPTRGTLNEKRRGPFPIAVAVEEQLPRSWYDAKDATPAKVRLAVIGHGGVFSGTMTPAKEKVLLDVSNWLLGRDDLLAKDEGTWQYPRLELSDTSNALWQWGTRLGLPLLFVYLGFVMLMVRRMR
jgi:hypothetical protein